MIPLQDRILAVSQSNFEETVLEVFRYQYAHVPVYQGFCDALGKNPQTVQGLTDIPFLPIEFFKTHEVITDDLKTQKVFESSGTTGTITSKHYVADSALYEASFLTTFRGFYGEPQDFVILALLPSYLERGNSSLVHMAKRLIELSGKAESGFFLDEFDKLHSLLQKLKSNKQKTLLLGVTFALLDFAEQFKTDFSGIIVMETGGMKGRREELTREELHARLKAAFGVNHIHSEYGMTELLSQGYSFGDGIFRTPPWMKILTRDMYDPLSLNPKNETGAVNVIDLANVYSCAFIATGDVARTYPDGSFEILGRMDNAELRGCNLMIMD